jgi:tetratricopeptide (TPR) repeat protein
MRNFTWKNEKSLWIDAVEKSPDLFRPHHNLGRYYDDHGYREEAIIEYKKALEKPIYSRKNEIFVTYYNLGRIYAKLKDYKKALSFYHRALVLNPDHAPSYNNIASIMERQGKPKLAHNYLIKAIKLDPSSSEINYNKKRELRREVFFYLGIAYKKKGQLGRAVTYFKDALKENPRNIKPHLHLAETFYRAGEYKKAKQEAELFMHLIQDKDTFSKILHDILRNDRSNNLHPSARIIIPLMYDACLGKSKTLKKWSELLYQKALWLKEEHKK